MGQPFKDAYQKINDAIYDYNSSLIHFNAVLGVEHIEQERRTFGLVERVLHTVEQWDHDNFR